MDTTEPSSRGICHASMHCTSDKWCNPHIHTHIYICISTDRQGDTEVPSELLSFSLVRLGHTTAHCLGMYVHTVAHCKNWWLPLITVLVDVRMCVLSGFIECAAKALPTANWKPLFTLHIRTYVRSGHHTTYACTGLYCICDKCKPSRKKKGKTVTFCLTWK